MLDRLADKGTISGQSRNKAATGDYPIPVCFLIPCLHKPQADLVILIIPIDAIFIFRVLFLPLFPLVTGLGYIK